MAYSRFELRGQLLRVLEDLPPRLRRKDIPRLMQLLQNVRALHQELVDKPYEYVSDTTIEEHRQLSGVFAQLLALSTRTYANATACFGRGEDEFVVCPEFLAIREHLVDETQGDSPSTMFLAKFFKDGRLPHQQEPG